MEYREATCRHNEVNIYSGRDLEELWAWTGMVPEGDESELASTRLTVHSLWAEDRVYSAMTEVFLPVNNSDA